jgi:uncharacterized protein YukJ
MSHHHHHRHGVAPHPQRPDTPQHSHRPVHHNRHDRGHFPQPSRSGDAVNYHLLKCRPVLNQSSPQVQHDHLQVLLEIDSGTRYWMTINVRSGADQVYYDIDETYENPILARLVAADLPQGFTALDRKPGGLSLDYIRGELVNLGTMDRLKSAQESAPDDQGIADMLTTQLVNVMRAPDARLFVFGSRFDDGRRYSSYDLATGIHDIHMNQGSVGAHAGSNGVYQDGALLAYYPSQARWSAVFLKFASQAERTDDRGNAIS